MPAYERFSRIAIVRIANLALTLGAALPMHHALSGARRKDRLLLEYDVAIKPAMLD